MNTSNNSHNNRKRNWLISLIVVLILIVGGYLNKNWLYTGYYYVFKYDHFEKGDDVYVAPSYFNDPNNNAIELYKLIRPLTNAEVNNLPLPVAEKTSIKLSLINAKTYLIAPHIDILKKYLKAHNTKKIGTYLKKDVLNIPAVDKDGKPIITFTLFYAIQPDKQVTYTDHNPYLKDMPKYYKWADNTLYVFPSDVTNKSH